MNEIAHFLTPEDRDIYQEWLNGLADRHAKVRIMTRVERLRLGNFGECRPLESGVWELKIDWGRGIEFIMPRPDKSWCCCSLGATSANRPRTSRQRLPIGATGKGGKHEGHKIPR